MPGFILYALHTQEKLRKGGAICQTGIFCWFINFDWGHFYSQAQYKGITFMVIVLRFTYIFLFLCNVLQRAYSKLSVDRVPHDARTPLSLHPCHGPSYITSYVQTGKWCWMLLLLLTLYTAVISTADDTIYLRAPKSWQLITAHNQKKQKNNLWKRAENKNRHSSEDTIADESPLSQSWLWGRNRI